LNLGDGNLEKIKQKREQAPLLLKVGDGVATTIKKLNKGGDKRPGDGTQELAKKNEKKGEQGPPSTKTWQWHP
jgi:hypothetical protein